MKRSYFTRLFLVTLMFASLCWTGCSTLKSFYGYTSYSAKSISRKILPGGKPALGKKVLVAPVINMAAIKNEKAGQITETWLSLLKKDNTLSITPLTGVEISKSTVTASELGIVTDPALVKKAEEMGENVLVTHVLEPFNYTEKKSGIWPFRKLKGEYDISMVVTAVDIINGTIIVSLKESETIDMGKVSEGQEVSPVLGDKIRDDALADIQKRLSSELLNALSAQEWRGKVVRDGEKIKINGGSDIGITQGSIFEVFAKGEAIKSVSGKDYYIAGSKAGEIKVTEVMQDHSMAVPLEGKSFEDGQIIIFKSK